MCTLVISYFVIIRFLLFVENLFLISDSQAFFKSRLRTFLCTQAFTARPAASASEVTTILRYINSIIIIFYTIGSKDPES